MELKPKFILELHAKKLCYYFKILGICKSYIQLQSVPFEL